MAGTNEVLAATAGLQKILYGSTLVNVLPDSALLQKKWKLDDSGDYPLVGDYFSAFTGLQYPAGVSFLGFGTEATLTNTTLNNCIAGQTAPAKVYANTTVLTDRIAYQLLDRAANAGEQAVMSALGYTGKQMAISLRNVLELEALHGQQGLGVVNGAISTLTVTFDGATTSIGILSALIGFPVQFFQANNTSARTAFDASNYLTIASVNISDPTAPTATLVATGTTNVAAVTTGDILYIGGARGYSVASSATSVPLYEQIGLGAQLAATSGTQFGIDKVNVGWVANQNTTVGSATVSALMNGAARILGRGGEGGEYTAIVPVEFWSAINSALATNEQFNSSPGGGNAGSVSKKTGTDEIMVKHSKINMTLMPHPFQKRAQIYIICDANLHRIGSKDLTFQVPGQPANEYHYPVSGNALIERQCRADWQYFYEKPPTGFIGTGVTYL